MYRMMSIRKCIMFLTVSMIACLMMGCSSDVNVESESKKTTENFQDSLYTYGKENQDGTYTLKVYSAPVNYEIDGGYVSISNKLKESDDSDYMLVSDENSVHIFYPQNIEKGISLEDTINEDDMIFYLNESDKTFDEGKKVYFKNMYGITVEAVLYASENEDYYFYSTNKGLRSEIVCHNSQKDEHSFILQQKNTNINNEKNGYVVVKNKKDDKDEYISNIITEPIVKQDSKIESDTHYVISDISEDKYCYTFSVKGDFNDEHIDFGIEYKRDCMADSTAYSKNYFNSYLSQYAILGQSANGFGVHSIRFLFVNLLDTKQENIKKVSYHTYILDDKKSDSKFELHENIDAWSSTKNTGATMVKYEEEGIEPAALKGHELVFDITDYAKKCFRDDTGRTEQRGMSLITSSGISRYVTTSDNSVYIPYVEYVFYRKPNGVKITSAINKKY